MTTLERTHNKRVSAVGLNLELPAIETQKNIAGKKCNTLVTVHERMIADQGLKQCSRHLRQTFVVTRLRAKERAFQQAFVAYT